MQAPARTALLKAGSSHESDASMYGAVARTRLAVGPRGAAAAPRRGGGGGDDGSTDISSSHAPSAVTVKFVSTRSPGNTATVSPSSTCAVAFASHSAASA